MSFENTDAISGLIASVPADIGRLIINDNSSFWTYFMRDSSGKDMHCSPTTVSKQTENQAAETGSGIM